MNTVLLSNFVGIFVGIVCACMSIISMVMYFYVLSSSPLVAIEPLFPPAFVSLLLAQVWAYWTFHRIRYEENSNLKAQDFSEPYGIFSSLMVCLSSLPPSIPYMPFLARNYSVSAMFERHMPLGCPRVHLWGISLFSL